VRVLVVNDLPIEGGTGTGGAEIYAHRVADGLRASGDDVEVFTRAAPRRGALRALAMWDPVARGALRRRVAAFGPEVIHHHNVFRELSASVLGAAPHVPAVMSVHDPRVVGQTLGELPGPLRTVDRHVKQPLDTSRARRHVDLMLPVSGAVDEWLRSAGFLRTRVIPVPVRAPAAVLAPPSASSEVVCVARLAAEKGFDVLVDAWRQISAVVPQARLVVVGDGPLRSWFEEQALTLRNVELLGWLSEDEVSGVLARARVVVSPVLGERLPQASSLVAVESAMHGRPFVGSAEPAVAGLVDSLGHGYVGAPGDAGAVATSVVRILRDPDLADRLGDAGRAAAERQHSIEAVTACVHDAYDEAIALARGAARDARPAGQ